MMKQVVSIEDFDQEQIQKIFATAADLKKNPEKYADKLKGKHFGLIFEKPSTRTRVSFEVGISALGGACLYRGPAATKLGEREEIRDVARVLDRYLSGMILRTFSHQTIQEFQQYSSKPVINGLSDLEHPCQALSDYFTISEKSSDVAKTKLAYVGDGNNVLNSLLLLAAKLGATLHYATPEQHVPDASVLSKGLEIAKQTGADIQGSSDVKKAVAEADFVYTDVWVSMGQEKDRDQKLKAFSGMQLNSDLLKLAKPSAYVMHCLPAHRGEEITDEVMESSQSIVFDQAENRMHVQKAILVHLYQ